MEIGTGVLVFQLKVCHLFPNINFTCTLEDLHLVEYGPYADIDGNKWVKCDKCFHPYHVHCLKEGILTGKYFHGLSAID